MSKPNSMCFGKISKFPVFSLTVIFFLLFSPWCQCSKLTVHTAPGVHNSAIGHTIFGTVRSMCARFFKSLLQYKYIDCQRGALGTSQAKVWDTLRPRGAQIKTLISNTECGVCTLLFLAATALHVLSLYWKSTEHAQIGGTPFL